MIDFRYHIVSIVAVFLALALGLFIGSTSLRGPVANDIKRRTAAAESRNDELQGQLSAARSELSRWQAFDSSLLPYVVSDRLAGSTVVVVSAPGADGALRDRLEDTLRTAGATVTGDVRLQDAILDPEQEQFLATLTDKIRVPARLRSTGTGAEKALGLLANVLGTRPEARPAGPGAVSRVLSAFTNAKLITVSGDPPRPSSLAVLLAAAPPAGTARSGGEHADVAARRARR